MAIMKLSESHPFLPGSNGGKWLLEVLLAFEDGVDGISELPHNIIYMSETKSLGIYWTPNISR